MDHTFFCLFRDDHANPWGGEGVRMVPVPVKKAPEKFGYFLKGYPSTKLTRRTQTNWFREIP